MDLSVWNAVVNFAAPLSAWRAQLSDGMLALVNQREGVKDAVWERWLAHSADLRVRPLPLSAVDGEIPERCPFFPGKIRGLRHQFRANATSAASCVVATGCSLCGSGIQHRRHRTQTDAVARRVR